ncbi:MAG: 1,2-phenylacetyl-CoA epoxidase subunit PaaC [Actinomycetota bacterium]
MSSEGTAYKAADVTSSDDTAYDALTEAGGDDHRWAFGTGFDDPLAGVDTSIPDGVNGDDLAGYCLMLGDDALIMSHRLQAWVARAPELEEEAALANVALDLLGQARLLLTRAGSADGTGRTEDDYAYQRDEHEFRNVTLVEAADTDFATCIARLLVFSAWRLALVDQLASSRDPVLAAIAAKAVKEITYHRDYAAQWVIRLGDGTQLSRSRMAAAMAGVEPFIGELFTAHPVESRLLEAGVAVDPATLRTEVEAIISQVLHSATLETTRPPTVAPHADAVGRDGRHTDAMAALLSELQSVARALPGATW